jgi:hypothetical protein
MSKKKHIRPQTTPLHKKNTTQAEKAGLETLRLDRTAMLVGLIAAVLGFLLYVNTFGHYYTLDDFSSIKDNWVVKGGLKNIGIIFSTEYRYGTWNSPGSLYRPIPLLMFALEWQLSPDKPFIAHLMNVAPLCHHRLGVVDHLAPYFGPLSACYCRDDRFVFYGAPYTY